MFSPGEITVKTSPEGGFMFGIYLFGLNLNDPNITYFNIELRQQHMVPILSPINSTVVPLVACTADHFKFNSDI